MAKVGKYRKFERTDKNQWKKDVKGALGERIAQPLFELTALAHNATWEGAEFVASQPISDSDIVIAGARYDVKTACDALPGVQDRSDRFFALNDHQLQAYRLGGYAGLVFVRVVHEGKEADIWYAGLDVVEGLEPREPVTENVAPWYAIPIPQTTGTTLPTSQ